MVKEIKSERFVVNQSKIRINFAGRVKNFHNLSSNGVLEAGLVELREIGWG